MIKNQLGWAREQNVADQVLSYAKLQLVSLRGFEGYHHGLCISTSKSNPLRRKVL